MTIPASILGIGVYDNLPIVRSVALGQLSTNMFLSRYLRLVPNASLVGLIVKSVLVEWRRVYSDTPSCWLYTNGLGYEALPNSIVAYCFNEDGVQVRTMAGDAALAIELDAEPGRIFVIAEDE